jgi:hypothetical protein
METLLGPSDFGPRDLWLSESYHPRCSVAAPIREYVATDIQQAKAQYEDFLGSEKRRSHPPTPHPRANTRAHIPSPAPPHGA